MKKGLNLLKTSKNFFFLSKNADPNMKGSIETFRNFEKAIISSGKLYQEKYFIQNAIYN